MKIQCFFAVFFILMIYHGFEGFAFLKIFVFEAVNWLKSVTMLHDVILLRA